MLLLCSRCGKVVILNVFNRYQCCVIFACFLSCVLGVCDSQVATPGHGLFELSPSLRLRFVSENVSLLYISVRRWASEVGSGKAKAPLDFEMFSEKGCFLALSGKQNFHRFWPFPRKIFENSPSGPTMEKILLTPMRPITLCCTSLNCYLGPFCLYLVTVHIYFVPCPAFRVDVAGDLHKTISFVVGVLSTLFARTLLGLIH